ncbi:acyl-CoA N-acyltransferase [Striga asiatica]|uniref:Acyl-CoA N-acyltransferase n=1 Tax=Striga asiatica TaxID=4170 RepID=A0A5A7QZN2_STRAF|nr:acyl-CoA N-acyltransferase [Striga asiatica]
MDCLVCPENSIPDFPKPNNFSTPVDKYPSNVDILSDDPFVNRQKTHFILDGISKAKASWAAKNSNKRPLPSTGHTPVMPVSQNHAKATEKTFLPPKQTSDKKASTEGVTIGKRARPYFDEYFGPEKFGSYEEIMDALEQRVSSYSLVYEHPSLHKPLKCILKKRGRKPTKEKIKKPKPRAEPKKVARKEAKRFPDNVKSLIVTGMLDGVEVKYVSFSSGEKLRGIIKDSGYQCGCESCNNSKTINAYEFEKHAGCKTSHPNNHIRFKNGKSIHEIVQVLKSTPDDMLCDTIQTVTGSPINQMAFLVWKESFEAGIRKRICATL